MALKVGDEVIMLPTAAFGRSGTNPHGIPGICKKFDYGDKTWEVAWKNGEKNNSYVEGRDIGPIGSLMRVSKEDIRGLDMSRSFDYSSWSSLVLDTYPPTTKKSTMSKLTTMFKSLVDADTQALRKAGFINGDLEITCEGQNELNVILFQANKAALVAVANAKIAEEAKK